MKANTHIVIKREDTLKYLTDNQIKFLNDSGYEYDKVKTA